MRLAIVAALVLAPLAAASAQPERVERPEQVRSRPVRPPTLTARYGPDPLNVGELRLPTGRGPFPVAVTIHGGCWSTKMGETLRGVAPLADALVDRGFAVWNVEYRQIGDAGAGWPGTFRDWGDAVDHLRVLARTRPLDLKRVVVVGHSAGAYAAYFVAGRPRLPASSPVRGKDPLPVRAAVALDGPTELGPFVGADQEACGMPVIAPLVGGTVAERPERYAELDPAARLPLGVAQLQVTTAMIPSEAAEAYRARVAAKGDRAEVLSLRGTHFDVIAPWTPNGARAVAFIADRALAR